ncbi:putative MFS family arabinose efflux permease [Streptomyces sp. Amel2xB2]|uniref:MFS transporter n=1 Tax=Streptomyces sp. Amel2xB2 TaxID=1305829 RepID=UPI000DB9169C|nr:MFS transporter [Streptomyces sp. Amel2xB2]RAJ66974.1 putative MFS family arabinose efflux permease [Streptomyces sp. Amel2xB2]
MRPTSRPAAFWLVAAAFTVTMLGTTLPTPLYGIYQAELRFSTLMVTVVFATYAAGVLAALLLTGHVSDEVGRRRALLPGLALSMLSSVVFLVAHDLALLFVGRLLSGLSAGVVTGTATAALVDLAGSRNTGRGSLVATVVQMGGLGVGPLLAGALAESAPAALRLPYAVHLGLLVLVTAGVWRIPEPVEGATGRLRLRVTRPTIPQEMRGTFTRAAIAGFAGFAVLGLFTAVSPAFLSELLDVTSLALEGGVIFAVFAASAAGQILLVPRLGRASLPLGCAGLVAGMLLLTTGFAMRSFQLLVAGGLVAGLGQGLSFRAGLSAVNAEAPAEHRAEVASTFFVVLYVALSLPVIGVGLAADLFGLRAAGIAFGLLVAALAGSVLAALLRARTSRTGASRTS